MRRVGRVASLVALLASMFAMPAAAAASPSPLGLPCAAPNANGVRFCQGGAGTPDRRIASFDGIPLDADVTLPGAGDGPWPTIVMIHGWGGDKTSFEAGGPAGDGKDTWHYNNVYFAQRGYAVLNYTARGFGNSCGAPASRTVACFQPGTGETNGWIHLKDRAVEAHDTQWLLGTLVDEGIARPDALGATGISYGGGESIELAYLRDRGATRATAGGPESLGPWRSPNGAPLALAGAYARWGWSDLVSSLVPNGRFLDFDPSTAAASRDPFGVPIQSFIEGLFALGATSGQYAPAGVDPGADLTTWHARVGAGDPYSDPQAVTLANEIHDHHQGFGLDGSPAPLLLESGFTDDLFPPAESLRVYTALRAANPRADVALQFGDLGHQRAEKVNSVQYLNEQGAAWLDAHLRGVSAAGAPAPGSVTAFTQTCPQPVPGGGPFAASSWQELHPGAFGFGSAAAQTVVSGGGNPRTAQAIDSVTGNADECQTLADESVAGSAVYRAPTVTGAFTMLGLPSVAADVAITGSSAQLDSRLWDVGPIGQQTLISRGALRLRDGQTKVVFQLHGNGWRFDAGHVPKLELVGQDAPYLQPNKEPFSVQVSNLRVELPTLERPGATPQIGAPLIGRPAGGTGGRRAAALTPLRLRVQPARVRAGRRIRFTFTVSARVRGRTRPVAHALVRFAGRRRLTNRRGRATIAVRLRRRGRAGADASARGYRSARAFVLVRR